MFTAGKKYQGKVTKNIYECLYADETGGLLSGVDAKFWQDNKYINIYKEYKEPVVHKRYVHWYIYSHSIITCTTSERHNTISGKPVLKVDEVTYVEEE